MRMTRRCCATLGLCLLVALWVPARASNLESLARQIADAGPQLAELWPGFWEPPAAFLLYHRSGECVLVSSTPPERDFRAHAHDRRLWLGRCEGLRFRPAFLLGQRFGGIEAPAVSVGRRSAPAVAESLLHEAFHMYQAGTFQRMRTAPLRFDTEAGRDLVELKLHEAALVVGAVTESDRDARAQRVRIALAIRNERLARMGGAAAVVEDHFMRIEGSAEWVGIGARLIVAAAGDQGMELRSRWRMLDSSAGATWERLQRWQSYHSGAAALALLDVDAPDWRTRMVQGAAPWALLEDRYGAADLGFEDALKQAQRLNRWAGIARSAARLARAQRRSEGAIARFNRQRGTRLELVGPPRSFEIAFTARDIHSFDDGVLIVDADPLVVEGDWVRLDARRRPMRVADQGGRLTLVLSGRARVSGCPGSVERLCPEGATIRARDVELVLTRPARLNEVGDRLRLQMVPEAPSTPPPAQR